MIGTVRSWVIAPLLPMLACTAADPKPGGADPEPGDGDNVVTQSRAPIITPTSGLVAYGTEAKIVSVEPGSEIRYTLDGTAPTTAALSYSSPILIAPTGASMTVRAIAIAPHKAPSDEAAATYTIAPGMIVHFKKPADWVSAHLHYWDTTPDGLGTSWPGPAMSAEGNDWYVSAIVGQTAANLVFNGGNAPQTADLNWTKPEGWFIDGDFWDVPPELMNCCAFPGGKYKALVMSYDDGNQQDKPLIEIFDAHGIKGTFHLNSGLMANADKVHADEAAAVYAGHEASVHSRTHPNLENLNQAQLESEILADKIALETIFGYPMRGLSYPFGSYNRLLLSLSHSWALRYGRVVPVTGDFRLPGDFLLWRGSAHHGTAWELAQSFIARTTTQMGVLCIWGHSWELDGNQPNNNWAYMEQLCETLGGRDDTWYVTMGDLADYVAAVRALQFSADGTTVYNPSPRSVFIKQGAAVVEVPTRQSLELIP